MTGVHIGALAAEHWADVERIYAAGIGSADFGRPSAFGLFAF